MTVTKDKVSACMIARGDRHVREDSCITARMTDYGARLMAVSVPDRTGTPTNVLLGLADSEDYRNDDCCFGAIIGRNANRVADARCNIAGAPYRLTPNEGSNNLHSGPDGYEHRRWTIIGREPDRITYGLISPDGDQGFPGPMTIQACYRVHETSLDLTIDADCPRTTIANMTSHAYWNLSGEGNGDILNHQLQVFTDQFCPTDAGFIPLAHSTVAGTAMDFRRSRIIGDALSFGQTAHDSQIIDAHGYNHAFVFDDADGHLAGASTISPETGLRRLASVYSPDTGIRMQQYSNAPSVLLYSAGFMNGITGTGGQTYGPSSGFALEPGFVPNAINDASEASPELSAGQHYRLRIRWEFGVEN